jgi:hypothetical protein
MGEQVDVYINLGDLYRAQGATGRTEAQNSYAAALQRDQLCAPAWRGLADLCREVGEHQQAVVLYQVRVTAILGRVRRWFGFLPEVLYQGRPTGVLGRVSRW